MPELSPDGRRLIYVGYTADGFDLFSLELDSFALPRGAGALERTTGAGQRRRHERYPIEPLQPCCRRRDRARGPSISARATFGEAFVLGTSGSDASRTPRLRRSAHARNRRRSAAVLPRLRATRGCRSTCAPRSSYSAAPVRQGYRTSERTPRSSRSACSARPTGVSLFLARRSRRPERGAELQRAPLRPGSSRRHALSILTRLVLVEPHQWLASRWRAWATATRTRAHLERDQRRARPVLERRRRPRRPGFWGSDDIRSPRSARRSDGLRAAALGANTTCSRSRPRAAPAVGTYPRFGLYSTGGLADAPCLRRLHHRAPAGRLLVLRKLRARPVRRIAVQPVQRLQYRFPLLYADRGISTLPAFLRTP